MVRSVVRLSNLPNYSALIYRIDIADSRTSPSQLAYNAGEAHYGQPSPPAMSFARMSRPGSSDPPQRGYSPPLEALQQGECQAALLPSPHIRATTLPEAQEAAVPFNENNDDDMQDFDTKYGFPHVKDV